MALSIRQPWAWLIVNGWKDIENREWATRFNARCLVHAGKVMTKADYEACALYCSSIADRLPPELEFPTFEMLKPLCGGIVGEMQIVECVTHSNSPWFCGPFGFVIKDAKPLEFQPFKGALGFFVVLDHQVKRS